MKCYMSECVNHDKCKDCCKLSDDEIYIDYGYGSNEMPCCMKFQVKGEPSVEEICYGLNPVVVPERYK